MRTFAERALRLVLPAGVLAVMATATLVGRSTFQPADVLANQSPNVPASPAASPTGVRTPMTIEHSVFDDANRHDRQTFEAMIRDVKARGFTAIVLVNGGREGNDELLGVSDRLGGVRVYVGAADEWNEYIEGPAPATLEAARPVVYPAADAFNVHPSFAGYYIRDEPQEADGPKVRLIAQALKERDPAHARFAVLAGTGKRITENWSDAMTTLALSVFPARAGAAECDFSDIFGTGQSFTQYIAARQAETSASVPLLTILQAHNGGSGDPSLRYPTFQEMRGQARLASERASTLSWFIYTSQQGWIGLKDATDRLSEAERIAKGTQAGPSCDGSAQAQPGPSPAPATGVTSSPTTAPTTAPTAVPAPPRTPTPAPTLLPIDVAPPIDLHAPPGGKTGPTTARAGK